MPSAASALPALVGSLRWAAKYYSAGKAWCSCGPRAGRKGGLAVCPRTGSTRSFGVSHTPRSVSANAIARGSSDRPHEALCSSPCA